MKYEIIEAEFEGKQTFLIGIRNSNGDIVQAVWRVEPIDKKVIRTNRVEWAWHTPSRAHAEKSLEEISAIESSGKSVLINEKDIA